VGLPWAGVEMEPYLEKAERTGRLIVPSKLGAIPDETYTLTLTELSLAGNMLKTVDARLASVRHASAAQHAHPRAMVLKCWGGAFAVDGADRAEPEPQRSGRHARCAVAAPGPPSPPTRRTSPRGGSRARRSPTPPCQPQQQHDASVSPRGAGR
jgi:hypothetical protein